LSTSRRAEPVDKLARSEIVRGFPITLDKALAGLPIAEI
jgi:hypothetical protein